MFTDEFARKAREAAEAEHAAGKRWHGESGELASMRL